MNILTGSCRAASRGFFSRHAEGVCLAQAGEANQYIGFLARQTRSELQVALFFE